MSNSFELSRRRRTGAGWRRVTSTLLLALTCTLVPSLGFADGTPPASQATAPARTEPTSLASASLDKRSDVSYQSSPQTWRNEVVGMVFVDRFNRGKPSTQETLQVEPKDPMGWHGGNINGVTEKLDYLKGHGVTTVWITPVMGNGGAAGSYHGYAITDFLDTDKHFGLMTDLTKMVAEAHKRGMRVILDIVVNHTGRVFEYKEQDKFDYSDKQKTVSKWNTTLYPKELQSPENFSRYGTVQPPDWSERPRDGGKTAPAIDADFLDGLRDFDLHKPAVQDRFIRIYKYLIARTGCDGFRVDTVKHVPAEFWPRFNREIKEFAATKLGMNNFGTFPEYFGATAHDMARLISPKEEGYEHIDPKGQNLGFTSALDFTSMNEIAALRSTAPTRTIEEARDGIKSELSESQLTRIGGFIDNHDLPRFLNDDSLKKTNLKVALARLYFRAGIPVVQYGTEQGARQVDGLEKTSSSSPADPGNRPDMFKGELKWKGAEGKDSFNTKAPLYRISRLYKDVRDQYPALRLGNEWARWSDSKGPGIYAFSRVHEGKEVIVVLNTADEPRSAANVWVDHDVWKSRVMPNGAAGEGKLIDALHPKYSASVRPVGSGKQYDGAQIQNVTVPPHGVRVLVYEREYVATPLRRFDDDGNDAAPHLAPAARPIAAAAAKGSGPVGIHAVAGALGVAEAPPSFRVTPSMTSGAHAPAPLEKQNALGQRVGAGGGRKAEPAQDPAAHDPASQNTRAAERAARMRWVPRAALPTRVVQGGASTERATHTASTTSAPEEPAAIEHAPLAGAPKNTTRPSTPRPSAPPPRTPLTRNPAPSYTEPH